MTRNPCGVWDEDFLRPFDEFRTGPRLAEPACPTARTATARHSRDNAHVGITFASQIPDALERLAVMTPQGGVLRRDLDLSDGHGETMAGLCDISGTGSPSRIW